MNGKELRAKVIGDSWGRAALILVLGLAGGGTGTTLLAQPRTDEEIRTIASREVDNERRVTDQKFERLADKIDANTKAVEGLEETVSGGIAEVLRRLPR